MKRLLALFSLTSIILLFFLPVIVSSSLWGFRDFHRYVYPMRYFGRECIRDFIIPFWNPFVGCGTPFFAGLQGCVFYPPSIIYYLFPYEIGLKAYIIFHFILSSLSSYALGRYLKLDKGPSFILSITWTFSGWLVSSIDIPIILASSSFLPLIFLCFLSSNVILTGICLSFQLLAGEPSIFYITSIFIFIFSIFVRKIKIAILSILIALSFSLFQIIPFLEFLLNSERISQGYAENIRWSFVPYEVFRFIIPSCCGSIVRGEERPFVYFGQMWLKSPYIGIVPFLLGIITIIYPRKGKIPLFFSFSFLISLLISFGNYFHLYKILYPLCSLMRYPVKFLYIATFSLSVLAGFGGAYLLEKRKNFSKAFVYTGLFIVCICVLLFFKGDEFLALFSQLSQIQLIKWQNMCYLDGRFIVLIIVFLISLFFLYLLSIIKKHTFIIALIGTIIIDLFFFQENLNPLVESHCYKKSDTIKFLEKHKGLFRICLSPRTNQYFSIIRGETLNEALENVKRFVVPNISMCFGVYEAGNYDSMYLNSYLSLKDKIAMMPFSEALRVLSMMNIRFIVSKDKLFEKGIKLVYKDKDMFLYENPHVLNRAYVVSDYVVKDNVLEYMLSSHFNPEKEVVFKEKPEVIKNEKCKVQDAKSRVDIIRYEPNRVVVDLDVKTRGFLFLSDTYYPGWKAYINGKETKVYKANYCFRAIFINPGKQIVEFRYIPRTFYIGLVGTIVSIFLIIIASFIRRS